MQGFRQRKNLFHLGVLWFAIVSAAATAAATDDIAIFWPTVVKMGNPQKSGALINWPEFKLLLHKKEGTTYTPVPITDDAAHALNEIFSPDPQGPIQLARDPQVSSWGLQIPGGAVLHPHNLFLLDPMVDTFVSCLSTLSDIELSLVTEVLYSPLLFISPLGSLRIPKEAIEAVRVMYANYQSDRCAQGAAQIPELTKQRVRHFIKLFLIGSSDDGDTSDGAQLVISTTFHQVLFTANGFWVRSSIDVMRKFLQKPLEKLPALTDTACLERDYQSFIDFVLLCKESGFNKNHFLAFAHAANVNAIDDAFKPFPLKQFIVDKRIIILNLELGTQRASLILKGAHS